jgi:hypothetical protein
MADDRTVVTELATALGMLGHSSLDEVLAYRPPSLRVDAPVWDRLFRLHRTGAHAQAFETAFLNGRAFLAARDGLRGRRPQIVEWTGGRRLVGDEVAPIDLRIDHVYLVSCKYLSGNIANTSPGRLFDGLLTSAGDWSRDDWYATTAPAEYTELYTACRRATASEDLPERPDELTTAQRRALGRALRGSYPEEVRARYARLCRTVSDASARRWQQRLTATRAGERMTWRLLRIGSAPYFVLGAHRTRPLRVRVASPWDWRQHFRFVRLDVAAGSAGQPQVDWAVRYRAVGDATIRSVHGRAEIRWSHGRFAQPPEAKIYLDTPIDEVPGYFELV